MPPAKKFISNTAKTYTQINMAFIICIVGGIYTVIKSKAQISVEELGEQYCLIGPYNESCVRTEVELLEPHNYVYKEVIREMRDAGMKVHCIDFIVYLSVSDDLVIFELILNFEFRIN